VCAYGAAHTYTNTPWSDAVSTGFDVLWFIYLLVGVIIDVILVLIIFCCMWRRCSMHEDKDALMQEAHEPKTPLPVKTKGNPSKLTIVMESSTSRPIAVNPFAQHVT
jgi:heme/copper-type cytochrome/quinol oxidase subunit 2